MDSQLSQVLCLAYNDCLYDFCQYSPDQCTEEDFAKADTAVAQRERKATLSATKYSCTQGTTAAWLAFPLRGEG